MPDYQLSVHSLTQPTLPEIPKDTKPSDIPSGLITGNFAAATSPLRFTLSLPDARPANPLHPATHLQLSYFYPGSGEVYVPDPIMPKDPTKTDAAGDETSTLYEVVIGPAGIWRVKVNEGESPDAEARLYAWRNEKLLGKFVLGTVEGVGIEGLKSFDLAKRRVEAAKERKAKKEAANSS